MIPDDDSLNLDFLRTFLKNKKDSSWNFVRFIIPKIIKKYKEDISKKEICIYFSIKIFNKYFYDPDNQKIILAFILHGIKIDHKNITIIKNKDFKSFILIELN